ncbi:MAG: glycosyl transferase family [Geobacteraceae bacterium]|nr:MAG: glycosyl transferase family [Geobacteraceae bacterium]
MDIFNVDIVVPVWNRPIETRNCLVNLAQHSTGARFILVDNGCDRETERLLQEFAERLDHNALLLRTDTNQGVVRAVNRGLARAEAAYVVVVRNTSVVTDGWLEPLVAFAESRPDAGVIIPRLIETRDGDKKKRKTGQGSPMEVSLCSLAAMLIRKELYDLVGGLEEEMDGGLWCLKDYSRRAYGEGFLTFAVEGGAVYYREETPLGSVVRREESLKRSVSHFTERWGEERTFCVHIPKGADIAIMRQRSEVMLRGARQGHFFTILVHSGLHKELIKAGFDRLHGNMRIEPLPLLFTEGGGRKILESLRRETPGTVAVAGIDGIPFPGVDDITAFSEVERIINAAEAERYGRGLKLCER